MQTSTIALMAATLISSASALQLTASGTGVEGYVTATHEGAGIDYTFVSSGSSGQEFIYDEANKDLYADFGSVLSHSSLYVYNEIVNVGIGGSAAAVTFEGGDVAINGTTSGFYACKNINDPYGYSTSEYAILFSSSTPSIGSDCVAIKLSTASNSTANATSSVPAATSSTAATSVPVASGAADTMAVGALAAGVALMAALF